MENTSVITLKDRQECFDAIRKLIDSAESSVSIFSQQLEPVLYNHPEICQPLSALARKNPHTTVRIIALDTRSAAADGHCLIRLAQKLSTYVQIRVPKTPELQRFSQSWLISDSISICEINNPDRYEGQLIENNRLHVKTQLEFFNDAWENSEPDVQTRRLSL